MNTECPLCDHECLNPVELEPGLNAWWCSACDGHWIPDSAYRAWEPERSGEGTEEEPARPVDSRDAKICRDCGRIMLRFPAGGDPSFHVDRCGACGGVWLDGREWQALKQRGLHAELPRVFSETWQKQLREDHYRRHLEARLESRLGRNDYATVRAFRRWLAGREDLSLILAYLERP